MSDKSDKIEVLITLPFADELVDIIRAISPRLNLSLSKAKKPEDIPAEQWQKIHVLYTHRILPSPEAAPNLRWVQLHWAGVDHALDAPLLTRDDILVTTMSGVVSTKVAEYVVLMLLSLGHRFLDLLASQRKGEWPKDRWERFSPRELRDAVVGIVGYGSIGRQTARLLAPFGARVLATKRDAMHPEEVDYCPEGFGDPKGDYVHRLYPAQALRSMLRECDFVVVTVPLTPYTKDLIGEEEFAVMKPNAFLVLVSRGGVVNFPALVSVLKDRRLAGAALDVFPEEPLPVDHPLWKLPNVIITPHISGDTPYYDMRAMELFIENLKRFVNGQPLLNRFLPELGY